MNQLCKVCGEPAAGFHFGAFTCEGCKSFFGRTYNNISAIAGCKNNGDCVINKKNRTACKACRLRKCLLVGMSKSGSRYGRRSNWFKIHCLLQEQQTTGSASGGGGGGSGTGGSSGSSSGIANFEQLARLHQIQARQTYQDKTNPCIKSASMSPTALSLNASARNNTPAPTPTPPNLLTAAAKFLNGVDGNHQHHSHAHHHHHHHHQPHQHLPFTSKAETRLSDTPSDSGASSAGDAVDDATSSVTSSRQERNCSSAHQPVSTYDEEEADARVRRHKQLLQIYRSHSEPLRSPFAPFALGGTLPPPIGPPPPPSPSSTQLLPPALKGEIKRVSESVAAAAAAAAAAASSGEGGTQEEPIDLSFKAQNSQRRCSSQSTRSDSTPSSTPPRPTESPATLSEALANVIQKQKTTPLDLTLVRTQTLTG